VLAENGRHILNHQEVTFQCWQIDVHRKYGAIARQATRDQSSEGFLRGVGGLIKVDVDHCSGGYRQVIKGRAGGHVPGTGIDQEVNVLFWHVESCGAIRMSIGRNDATRAGQSILVNPACQAGVVSQGNISVDWPICSGRVNVPNKMNISYRVQINESVFSHFEQQVISIPGSQSGTVLKVQRASSASLP
jgi:hypothetical protein